MSEYLFVYGTLKPGCVPELMAGVAAQLRAMAEGSVRGALYNLGGYPGAVPNAGATDRIFGTVMELPADKNILRALDEYEGFDPAAPEACEFVRELREVELAADGSLNCWFYRYNRKPDEASLIVDGIWRE